MDTMQRRGTERLVLAIGQVSASHHTVWTPSGSAPVNDVSWTIGEDAPLRGRGWRRSRSGAAATVTVTLTVTVTGPGWQHVEDLGPWTAEEVAAVRGKVTQARMLALRAVVWSLPRPLPGPAPLPVSLPAPLPVPPPAAEAAEAARAAGGLVRPAG